MRTYSGFITFLKKKEVFVFGSNLQGFHGGGSAGFASFGYQTWRNIRYDQWPEGQKGLWNVKGCAEGYQQGTQGRSYAIPTVVKPTSLYETQSLPLSTIRKSIEKFYVFANLHPEFDFLVAYTAKGRNLNGYTAEEMASIFHDESIPENVIFEDEFAKLVNPRSLEEESL